MDSLPSAAIHHGFLSNVFGEGRLAGGMFGKLGYVLGTAAGVLTRLSDDFAGGKVAAHFKDLRKVGPTLPHQVVRYVADGENPSVLVTLQGKAAQERWRMRGRSYPSRDEAGVFSNLAEWRIDQMQRLGEALAALEPITHDWGYFGTKKAPDWLRHVVTLWLGHGRPAQPVETLLALAAEAGEPVVQVLDILFCRDAANYGSSNSVARFSGVADWLGSERDAVLAAASGLGADVRAELAAAIGRFGLHNSYLDLLVELAVGSSKKARTAARQALTGADRTALAEALQGQFTGAAPGRRAELVEVAATTLGEGAAALLGEWSAGERSAKVLAAFDRVSGAVTAAPSALSRGSSMPLVRDDGPGGYAAVDGSWVKLAEPEPLPGPSAVPNEVLDRLKPAMVAFNGMLALGKVEAKSAKHWHWSKQYQFKDARDLEKLAEMAAGTRPVATRMGHAETDWLRFQLFKHAAVSEFFHDPRLTLYHLVRLAVATSNGQFAGLFNDWSGPAGAAMQKRLADGADVRTILALWSQAGGSDYLTEHLARRWYYPLPEFDVSIWPVLCTRFDQLDEALGMIPQRSADPLRPMPALELLAMFPKLPERYRGQLMLLANDSSAKLRERARGLLQQTPGIGGAIALQLQDGRQETRALAADWLAARGEREQAQALRAALAKERSDLAKAAMITALERLGEDVSAYFDPAALAREAKAGLAKARPKDLEWFPFDRLPALKWADGSPVDPVLPEWWVTLATKLKQPGGNALMNLWLDRLAPGDAHRLGWMVLTGWIDEDTRTPTDEEANAFAAQHVDATLQQNISCAKRWPESADYWPTDRAVVFARLKQQKASTYLGSAADSKGILALATRVNGADAAQRIRPFLKDHGQRVSQAKALLELLAAIGTSAALQLVLSAANRSKQRSVQAHAAALVEQIAERNGWSAAQLADRTIPTGGFDTDGSQDLECGDNRTYTLRLDAQDAVVILNTEGREIKALPGPRTDEERPVVEAAKKQLSTARKEVKQVLSAQSERLQEAMCLQRSWELGEWMSFIAGHPIVGRLAARLVWQGVDANGEAGATFRPLGDGSYTDAADAEVSLANFAEVRLAHSSLLGKDAIGAWRKHLADYAVESPFDQLGRDLPRLDEAQANDRSITDREGWMIETFKLRGLAAKLGYQRAQAVDGGWFVAYERSFRDAGLLAEIEFSGSPLPEENRPAALQSLSFRKLRGGGGGGSQVPLGDVPPVLLAETWRDLHDIAEKGTGFDAEWQKKAY